MVVNHAVIACILEARNTGRAQANVGSNCDFKLCFSSFSIRTSSLVFFSQEAAALLHAENMRRLAESTSKVLPNERLTIPIVSVIHAFS